MGTAGQYVVFFEASQKGYAWWVPGLGLLVVLIGKLTDKGFRDSGWGLFRLWSFSGSVMFWFGWIWTLLAFGGTFPGYVSAQYAYRTGHCEVVEGQVTDFAR